MSVEATSEEAKELIEQLIGNLRDAEKAISSGTLLMLALATANELILSSGISGFSMFGFAVSNLSYMSRAGLVAMSAVYFSIVSMVSIRRMMEEVYDVTFKRSYPGLAEVNYHEFCRPIHPMRIYYIINPYLSGFWSTGADLSVKIIGVILLFGPPAYVASSALRCFLRYGYTDLLTIVTSLVAGAFLVQALLLPIATMKAIYGQNEGLSI